MIPPALDTQLHPAFRNAAKAFWVAAEADGLDLVLVTTWRDPAVQAKLYAQGRTEPGKIVTWAKPGQSAHNVTRGGRLCGQGFLPVGCSFAPLSLLKHPRRDGRGKRGHMLNQAEISAQFAQRRPDHSLPQALYCDEGVLQADLNAIFYKDWIFAASAAELPKAGAYVTLQLGAYPVVIVKGSDGEVRAFHNVCRHRGQRLCSKTSGSTVKLVCPYHQWTYDLDGKLMWAREMGPEFKPANRLPLSQVMHWNSW